MHNPATADDYEGPFTEFDSALLDARGTLAEVLKSRGGKRRGGWGGCDWMVCIQSIVDRESDLHSLFSGSVYSR